MPEVTGARDSKPSNLSGALYGIDEVLDHLHSLKESIEGGGSGTTKDNQKNPTQPLSQLLEEGPGMVTSKCQKAHEVINEIESLLF